MNKRIAKKRFKSAVRYAITQARKDGVVVIIKTQAWINEKGKECSRIEEPNGKMITLKRPKVTYIKIK